MPRNPTPNTTTKMTESKTRNHILLDHTNVRIPEEVMIALAARLADEHMALDYAIERALFALAGYDITNRGEMYRMGCYNHDEAYANTISQRESPWKNI
jgi:hypothetical protein